jgi:uncharacterized RmlC-like cupin family protein
MATVEKKSLNRPEDTKKFEKLKVEVVTAGGLTFQRVTAEPGWRWSNHLKPVVKTESCQKHHVIYVISGRLHARMNDGKEEEYGPGDIAVVPPRHDGWTAGKEPVVWLEIPH